jgi:TRAP-type C4-dicarboxylate transport system permease small subunit
VAADPPQPRAQAPNLLDGLTSFVAIAGGLLTLATAVVVTASVIRRNIGSEGIPGDFEYVQMGTALAVFAFLPYCQLKRGNIVVDTFSTYWPARLRDAVDALWDLVYAGITGLLAWSLLRGALDVKASGTTTMVMGLPIWPAVLACAALCGVLSAVCLLTAWRLIARPA